MSDLTEGAIKEWCKNASPKDLLEYGKIIVEQREETMAEYKKGVSDYIVGMVMEKNLPSDMEFLREMCPSTYTMHQEIEKLRAEGK